MKAKKQSPAVRGGEVRDKVHIEIKSQIDNIIQLASKGMSAVGIAAKLSAKSGNVSSDTVLRALKKNGIKLPHGGRRSGAGRKSAAESVTEDELLRQQAIDCAVNSWEVGLRRHTLSDKNWFTYAGSAYQPTAAGRYVRRKNKDDDDLVAAERETKMPAGLPGKLPR